MILLLVRHGIAEDIDESEGSDDAYRQLTPKGRRKVREMGRFLAERGFEPTLALTSLRTRAIQTAEIILEELASGKPLRMLDSMDVDATWADLKRDIIELIEGDDDAVVLAVGHLPSIGAFFSSALGLKSPLDDFRKGGVAAIEWRGSTMDGPGELLFYMTPRYAETRNP
jgi:phosphohistidine phosphatase